MLQNIALLAARKAKLSSTFRNVARPVAACEMSIATNEPVKGRLLCLAGDSKWRQRMTELIISSSVANVCNLQCFAFVIVATQVARKIAQCHMTFSLQIRRCFSRFAGEREGQNKARGEGA